MEEMGKIIEIEGESALVRIVKHSACSKCNNKCHLAGEDSHESDQIDVKVINNIGAKKGQMVKLAMEEQPLIIASLIVYILPLMALIAGYFLGMQLAPLLGFQVSEGAGIIGSLVALGLSFLLIKALDGVLAANSNFHPRLIEIIK